VKSIKALGITISYDLSWRDHIHDVVNKASRVLGVIERVLGSKSNTEFSLLYKSLVRPILEYAAPVWCPFLVKDIVLLEKFKGECQDWPSVKRGAKCTTRNVAPI